MENRSGSVVSDNNRKEMFLTSVLHYRLRYDCRPRLSPYLFMSKIKKRINQEIEAGSIKARLYHMLILYLARFLHLGSFGAAYLVIIEVIGVLKWLSNICGFKRFNENTHAPITNSKMPQIEHV